MDNTRYEKVTESATFQGKSITVTHLTPALTSEQRAKRNSEVEHQLYEVFSKYKKPQIKAR
jgi:hypothetical protein